MARLITGPNLVAAVVVAVAILTFAADGANTANTRVHAAAPRRRVSRIAAIAFFNVCKRNVEQYHLDADSSAAFGF